MRLTIARKVLLTVGTVIDEIDDWMDVVTSPSRFYIGQTSKNYHRYRDELKKLTEVGYVKKEVKRGKIYYQFTSQGWEKLFFDFPVFRYMHGRWDGWWTLVIYDIKEQRRALRNSFRRQLKKLTFGKYQQSVWITPHPVVEEVRALIMASKLEGSAHVYRAKQVSGDPRENAWVAWNLANLERKYFSFNKKWKRKLTGLDLTDRKNQKLLREIGEEYAQLLLVDPGLPKELLPKKWEGYRTRNLMRFLYRKKLVKK